MEARGPLGNAELIRPQQPVVHYLLHLHRLLLSVVQATQVGDVDEFASVIRLRPNQRLQTEKHCGNVTSPNSRLVIKDINYLMLKQS